MEAQNERKEELGEGDKGIQRRWMLELKLSDKREAEWRKVAKSTIDRYRGRNRKKNSFNILWSNTETLMPAVYNSLPQPNVRRRFKDEDPVGKAVSDVLSRSLEFSVDIEQFDTAIKHSLLDMLLTGRGVNRIRYVPSFEQVGYSDEEPTELESAPTEALETATTEELNWEQVVIEHVQYDDFRMGAGKTWEEVQWIAFHHRMTRDDLCEKFGDKGEKMRLDDTNDEDVNREDESTIDAFKTASVWEIWDKEEKQVIFVSQNCTEPLKVLEDPLELTSFFPIARPVYAIVDGGTMLPTTLYSQYQEQAEELDKVSTRINKIYDALKVRGIYDSTMSEVSELLKGNDNDLIPAQNAAAWLERGGIEKAIWMMPIENAAKVVVVLTQQREACKQVIYEINGLGDILRGQSNASETLGAQQIKAQWGTMRISTLQRELQRYIRDMMRIMAEIISEKFQLDTLQKMTGLNYPTDEQVQQAMLQYQSQMEMYNQQAQMAQMQPPQAPGQPPMGGQPPPQPPQQPTPPPFTWESLQKVMKDDCQRTYKIDVETDSTTASTVQEDMKGLTELLSGIVAFVQGVAPAVQMGALPMEAAKEIMMTICRRSKMGSAVEDALDKMKEPPAPQDPNAAGQAAEQAKQQLEMRKHQDLLQLKNMELQGQAQLEQAKLAQSAQLEQMKTQATAQSEQMRADADAQASQAQAQASMEVERFKAELKAQSDEMAAQYSAQMEMAKLEKEQEFERWKAELDASTKILLGQISSKTTMDTAMLTATNAANTEVAESLGNNNVMFNDDNNKMDMMMQMHNDAMGQIGSVMEHLQKPRTILRDANGKIAGVQ
jgi:hypothetical protein